MIHETVVINQHLSKTERERNEMVVMKQDFSKKEVICRTVVINQHLSKMEREREMRWLS